MEIMKSLKVVKFKENIEREILDSVIIERPIKLFVNDNPFIILQAIPADLDVLAIGYLLSEGILSDLNQICNLVVKDLNIYISTKLDIKKSIESYGAFEVKGSSSGRFPKKCFEYLNKSIEPKDVSSKKFNSKHIFEASKRLNEDAVLFNKTGGAHVALLMDDNFNIIAFAEDVGRHNALDKVFGKAALKGIEFKKLLLATSGRLSFEMVCKAIRLRIPIMLSISAPTDMGIDLAQKTGLTLVGFVRKGSYNIYSNIKGLDI